MKILIIHNTYQHKGGEDTTFKVEQNLLLKNDHELKVLLFDNKTIISFSDKIKTGINTIYNPKSARKVEAEIVQFQPDVIHVHNFFPIASPSIFFIAKKHNIPIVMTLQNFRLLCANGLLFRNGKICEDCINKILPLNGIMHKCYRNSSIGTTAVTLMASIHKIIGTWKNKVDIYITLSEFASKKYLQSSLKISPDKIKIKQNFVEDPGDEVVKREDFFLFVGRLAEEKRIETIVLSLQHYKYKIKIIGDGPYRSIVEDAASKNKDIEYLGLQSREVVFDYMKKAKALLFTSLWYEGMPLTILEAFSTGTPIICSNVGVHSTLIKDGVNGLHFIAGNEYSLADKVKYFEENPEEMTHLYLNARQTYIESYTPEKNYKLLLEIYTDAIKKKQLQT